MKKGLICLKKKKKIQEWGEGPSAGKSGGG